MTPKDWRDKAMSAEQKETMSEHKLKDVAVENNLKGSTPVIVGTKDGSCFYGESANATDLYWSLYQANESHGGSIALRLWNCQMVAQVRPPTKTWFDLALHGPDDCYVVSPPVEVAVISEITKVLSCSDASARRWKAQGSVLSVMPGAGRIVPARNQ